MRRVVGSVLLGLGVLLVVAAAMLRFYVAPQLVVAPLDQSSETVSEAEDATYLDIGLLEVQEGRTLVATRTVRGDVQAGSAETAVYDVFVKTQDPEKPGDGEEQLVSATTDRFAFDRRTSEAVNCCDENLNGEEVEHEGIQLKFPFGTEQRTYQYFDTSLGRATDMEFVEEETVEGLGTYRFQQVIEPTEIARLDVPGSLVGLDETSVELGRFYSNVRTAWVEPVSGVIVRGEEEQLSSLRDDDGEDLLTITEATLAFTDDTVSNQADAAQDARGSARLLGTLAPLGALVLGLVLIGIGILVLRQPSPPVRRSNRARTSEPTPVA